MTRKQQRCIVRKVGRSYEVFDTQDRCVVEGGFFYKDFALESCAEWNKTFEEERVKA